MKENDSSVEVSDPAGKSHGWRKMPGRFFSHKDKDRKTTAVREQQTQDDLDAFLKPSTDNAAAYAATVSQRPVRPLAPKIDVSAAQRFPAAQGVPGQIAQGQDLEEKFVYSKPTRRLGLKVDFIEAGPEVIGFGGDESEDPVLEIARRRRQRSGSHTRRPPPPSHPPVVAGPPRLPERPHAELYNINTSRNIQPQTQPAICPPEEQTIPAASGPSDAPVSPEWVARESDRIVDMPAYSLEEPDLGPEIPKIRRAPTGYESIPDAHYPASEGSRDSDSFDAALRETSTFTSQETQDSAPVPVKEVSPSRRISQIDPTQRLGLKKMREDEGRAFISAKSPVQTHGPSSSQTSLPQNTLEPSQPPQRSRPSFDTVSTHSRSSIQSPASHSAGIPSPPAAQSRFSPAASPPTVYANAQYHHPSPSPSFQQQHSPRPTSRDRFASPQGSTTNLYPRDGSPQSMSTAQARDRNRNFGPSTEIRPRPSPLHDVRPAAARPPPQELSNAQRDMQDSQLRDSAFFEFASNVSHMRHVFRLSTQNEAPLAVRNLSDWVRAAHWWFLIGRDGIEKALRSKSTETMDMRYSPSRTTFSPYLQHHVNLAKAWWIVSDVVSSRIETLKQSSRDVQSQTEIAEADEARDEIVNSLKKVALSLSKRGAMPSRESLAQGLDNSIWIRYPELPPEMGWILSEKHASSPSKVQVKCTDLPISDTDKMFCIGRFSVSVLVLQADMEGREHQIHSAFPCIVTLFRRIASLQMGMIIASQSSLVNVIVQDSNTYGATWEHVRWESQLYGLRIKLPRKLRLRITCTQNDYNNLWGAYDYSQKVNSSLQRRPDEQLIQRWVVSQFTYTDTVHSDAFPAEPMPGCSVFLFEKSVVTEDGPHPSRLHGHYRLAIVTNMADKLLRSVSIDISRGMPVQYVYGRTEQGDAHLEFFINEYKRFRSIGLAFPNEQQRDYLRDCVVGRALRRDEASHTLIQDVAFTVSGETTGEAVSVFTSPVTLEFISLEIINAAKQPGSNFDPPVVRSENLRVILQGKNGMFVDRMNFGQAELQVRLDVDMSPSIKIFRRPRHDMTLSMGPLAADQNHLAVLQRIQHTVTSSPTVNIYSFRAFPDLFEFQQAITGFEVLYDGRANSFAISRRRMIVPVYKKWDTDRARIQIVHQGEIIQLLAFFEGYNLAEAFNFQLRSTDFFEKIDGGKNTHAVKLVNAKFSLPLPNSDRDREGEKTSKFVNLDVLENPTESEDITIGFENEEERDRFAAALPAAASAGRKFTLMRRI